MSSVGVDIDKLAQCSKLLYSQESITLSKEIKALQEEKKRLVKMKYIMGDNDDPARIYSPFKDCYEQDIWFEDLLNNLKRIYSAPFGEDTESNTSLLTFLTARVGGPYEFSTCPSEFFLKVIDGRMRDYLATNPVLVRRNMVETVVCSFKQGRIFDVYTGVVAGIMSCKSTWDPDLDPVYHTRSDMVDVVFHHLLSGSETTTFADMLLDVVFDLAT